MSGIFKVPPARDTRIKETLELSLSESEEMTAVIVLSIRKGGELLPSMRTSGMNMGDICYLSQFLNAYVARRFHESMVEP